MPCASDPDVERGGGLCRRRHGQFHAEYRPALHCSQAARVPKASAGQIIARLREAVRGIEGVDVFFQAAQDLQIDTRTSRTQYQYILEGSDAAELAESGAKAGWRS